MKRRSATGNIGAGRRSKKSSKRRAHHRLYRRKRSQPTAPSPANVGATRPDTRPAVSLQLEDCVGYRRRYVLELLLSDLRGNDPVRMLQVNPRNVHSEVVCVMP